MWVALQLCSSVTTCHTSRIIIIDSLGETPRILLGPLIPATTWQLNLICIEEVVGEGVYLPWGEEEASHLLGDLVAEEHHSLRLEVGALVDFAVVALHNCLELQGELRNFLGEEEELRNCPEGVEEELHSLVAVEGEPRNCLAVVVAEELRNSLAVAEALVEGDLAVDGKKRHLEEQNEEVGPSLLVVLHSKAA
jgi:hypothetical protein